MKNKIINTSIMVFTLFLIFTNVRELQSADKMARVDMKRCFKEYYESKEGEKIINNAAKEADKDIKSKGGALEGSIKKINELAKLTQDPLLSQEQRANHGKELVKIRNSFLEKQKEVQEFAKRRATQINVQKQDLIRKIRNDIIKVIEDISKANSFDFVIDKSSPSILFTSDKIVEITDQVIEKLNSTEKKEKDSGKD